MLTQRSSTEPSWLQFWPALLGPIGMALVYVAWALEKPWLYGRALHEPLATHLMAAAVGCYAMAAWRKPMLLHRLLLVLAIAFLCREIHFAGTDTGVYLTLAGLGAASVIYRKRLLRESTTGRIGAWLSCTAWTYVLSQLIARRVFRSLGLPHEDILHIGLEEVVENAAHLLLIVTAFASEFRRG